MGAGTDFVLGGLLSGLGKGLSDDYEEKRKEALLNLQHEWDTETETRKEKAAADLEDTKLAGQLLVTDETGAQNRQTEGVKGQNDIKTALAKAQADRSNIVLKGSIDLRNSTTVQNLMHTNRMSEAQLQNALDIKKDLIANGNKIGYTAVSPSGEIGFYSETGQLLSQTKPGATTPKAGGDGEGPTTADLQDANAAAGGDGGGGGDGTSGTAQPRNGGNDALRRQALARLPGIYLQAKQNPDAFKSQYPAMFDANGDLLPLNQLEDQINQRYGGQ